MVHRSVDPSSFYMVLNMFGIKGSHLNKPMFFILQNAFNQTDRKQLCGSQGSLTLGTTLPFMFSLILKLLDHLAVLERSA